MDDYLDRTVRNLNSDLYFTQLRIKKEIEHTHRRAVKEITSAFKRQLKRQIFQDFDRDSYFLSFCGI